MNLATIWHMHQPDYRDDKGVMQMPWVFLHSIKDYYDMPWMMSRHKDIKATFNITPPLIEQIKLYYGNPVEYDYFLTLWLKNPNQLNSKEREWVSKICRSAQFETMVLPLPYFKTLFLKEDLNDSEFFDLEILFMLSWCGVYLRENSTIVSSLIKKGRGYSLDEKSELIEELGGFIRGIFDYYKTLHVEGRISISTTPLNHPILPLLLDMQNAKEANPNTQIPQNHLSLKEDAKRQISEAIEIFEETFDFTPKGFWPAEGAVDEKSIELLKSFGIKWIATDEEILFKSLQNRDRKNLYHPYNHNGICIGFRDHGLSDLIGFTYRFQEADKASTNFISTLKSIKDEIENPTVFVILDGENAWEFYKNNGYDFFNSLYEKLSNLSWCQCITMDDICNNKQEIVKTISPGSWINGEFNTWVGHREKTKAWEMIFEAKREYEHVKSRLDTKTRENIDRKFLTVECSDWFWWYGDDHDTDFKIEFDKLFRGHLISIYNLSNLTPPIELFQPITNRQLKTHSFHTKPKTYITPYIDGKIDSFFEWFGCGVIDEKRLNSTMEIKSGAITKIYYGQDSEYIYFAFLTDRVELSSFKCFSIKIEPLDEIINIPLEIARGTLGKSCQVIFAHQEIFECKIKKRSFPQNTLKFSFLLSKEKTISQTVPSFGKLEIDLSENYNKNWFV